MKQQGSILMMCVVVLAILSLLLMAMLQSQKNFLWLLQAQQQRHLSLEQAENVVNRLLHDNFDLWQQQFEHTYIACFNSSQAYCQSELLYQEADYEASISATAEYVRREQVESYWKLSLSYQGEHDIVLEVAVNPKPYSQWLYYD